MSGTLGQDAVAGVLGAIASVPDGMASAVLVGVNPVYGLYGSMAGPIGGGLTVGSRLMVVTTTTAAALAAGSALSGVAGADRSEALFLLTAVAGVMMVAAGLFRVGRYTRFVSVSVSVLTGSLTGVAVNIILGQIGDLLGSPQKGSPAVEKAWNVLTHPGEISLTATAVGLGALLLMILLSRTPISSVASLVALLIPTLVALGAGDLVRVQDEGQIPSGLPTPHLPHLSLLGSFHLVIGAAAVAVIVLVQGTGVAEAAPNPDGSRADPNRDFIGQGIGNLASGLFRGQPVGGSVSQTALNLTAGARGRRASIFSGLWMLLILVAFSGVVGKVPIPTLAAVLVYAAARSLRVGRIDTVLRTGPASRIAFFATLAATLVLLVSTAVGIGVVLSLLLQLNQEAVDLTVVGLQRDEHGDLSKSPRRPGCPVTRSPRSTSTAACCSPVLAPCRRGCPIPLTPSSRSSVLRLRGRGTLGATAFIVLADYAERLQSADGHLFLSGVSGEFEHQLRQTPRVDNRDAVTLVPASPKILESTQSAWRQAEEWLAEHSVGVDA